MKKGSEVKVKQPVIKGLITKVEYDDDADEKRFKVDFKDEQGNAKERWVLESQVELVGEE